MDCGVDLRRVQSAGARGRKPGQAANGNVRALQLENPGQVEISAGQIESDGVARRVISSVARDSGLIMFQLDIFEPDLFAVEIDRRTETLNRFAIDGAIAQQNLSLPDGSRSCARHLHLHIDRSRDRIGIAGKGEDSRQVGILGIKCT